MGNLDRNAFLDDAKTQSAVLHQLLLLGEAVKRLTDDFRNAHLDVPWKQIAGMRDVLIHQYDVVDPEEVWVTVRDELPPFIARVERLAPRDPTIASGVGGLCG